MTLRRTVRTDAPPTAPPLRVLRLIARLNIGGPARHTVILDHGLREIGFETLLVHGSTGAMEASLEDFARRRNVPTAFVPELGRRIHPLDDLRAFLRVLRHIREAQPDVVHTHTAKAGAVGRLAGLVYNATRRRTRRCAMVHTFHGHVFAGYFGTLGTLAVRLIEKTLATMTDRIVAISERQRDDLVLRFGIAPASRVSVVPLGLELEELLQRALDFRGIRSTLRLKPDDVVLGFVGRLVPVKDVATLIRAGALAIERIPNLRLVIAGDGECRASLEQVARDLLPPDTVQFLGWRRDLVELYAAFDLFVLSSLNEGTPVSLIEAMAAGVPAIATAVGGVPDVLHDGESGILVPARDPNALAEAICRAAAQPRRSGEMADRARLSVAARYGAGRLVADMARLYAEAVAERRGTVAAARSVAEASERVQH